jgi:hypothetical protein
MNNLLDKTAAHLTGENVLNTNLEELETLSQQHPYFSVAHLLLAKKYQSENLSNFLPQAQKAALYFNNPHLLHYQLMESFPEISVTENDEIVDSNDEALALETEEEKPVFDIVEETENPSDVFSNEEIGAASSLAKDTLAIEALENILTEEEDETEITLDELHPEKEEVLEEIVQENIDAKNAIQENFWKDNQNITKEKVETITEVDTETFTLNEVKETEIPVVIKEPVPEKDLLETIVENNLVQPVTIDEPRQASIGTQVSSQDEPKEVILNTSPLIEPLIPIEPYYTVDYFASQGIKLILDKNPQDKLGKQLRSFTEWLKHMKKLGPEDAIKPGNETDVDPAIKNIADTSNTPEEILTEAMADVLIKQGKNHQAIELYNKLSFLNPDKSAYFANQIQKLKGA